MNFSLGVRLSDEDLDGCILVSLFAHWVAHLSKLRVTLYGSPWRMILSLSFMNRMRRSTLGACVPDGLLSLSAWWLLSSSAISFVLIADSEYNTSQTKWKGGRCHEQYMHVSALYENGFFLTYYVYMCFLVTFSSTCNFKIEVRFVRLRRKLVRSKFNTLILKHNHPKEV